MAEYWDLFDAERNLTGKSIARGNIPVCTIPDGYYHIVINAWIRNSEGKYLVSKRAAHRPSHPLKWECTGGSVLMGESSADGAVREVKEELGIKLDKSDAKLILSLKRDTVNGVKHNDFLDVWLFECDCQPDMRNAECDEVAQAKWVTYSEFAAMIENGETTPTVRYFTSVFAE